MPRETLRLLLEPATTKAASYAPSAADFRLDRFNELVVTLKITSAERDSADETYDFYIITGDGLSEWDVVHFPQVATTGAKTFTARVRTDFLPQTVTTGAPGVAVVVSGTLSTAASATNAAKTLAAGLVSHGPFGNYLRYELVVAGTVVTGIAYSLQVQARA